MQKQKTRCNINPTIIPGPPGPPGTPGTQGATGSAGAPGAPGATGTFSGGFTGNVLFNGDVGIRGNIGMTGNIYITGDIIPSQDNVFHLGITGRQFKELHVSAGTIYIGGVPISSSNDTIVLPLGTTIGDV